jgi:hypothetical protein
MLKKIILVATLATASVVSLNLMARPVEAPTPSTVTLKWPPCNPWQGTCAANN